MKYLIVVPTYNEVDNISELLPDLLKEFSSLATILVIDDNSPDGTSKIVNNFLNTSSNVILETREKKLGVASAFIRGFTYAIENSYEFVVCMDSDLSHQVKDLKNLLKKIETYPEIDFLIGSRYIRNGKIRDVPVFRVIVSKLGNLFARLCIGTRIHDATGGFRIYRTECLKNFDLDKLPTKGYGFQLELLALFIGKNYVMSEHPIEFLPRKHGKSKLTLSITLEVFLTCLRLFRKRF